MILCELLLDKALGIAYNPNRTNSCFLSFVFFVDVVQRQLCL
jgi:hypothetical protein